MYFLLPYFTHFVWTQSQGFVKILIEKSDLDRMAAFKHKRGDEVHKILMVVWLTQPSYSFYSSYSNVVS